MPDERTIEQNWGTLGLAGAGQHAVGAEPPLLVLKVVDRGRSTRARPNARVLVIPRPIAYRIICN